MAFEVSGDSMLPKYENGDVIVVYREQRYPLSSFYGEEAAVRLKSGERYLKTIERGSSSGTVNLKSFNAKPINGVKLEWIGEICVTLPAWPDRTAARQDDVEGPQVRQGTGRAGVREIARRRRAGPIRVPSGRIGPAGCVVGSACRQYRLTILTIIRNNRR